MTRGFQIWPHNSNRMAFRPLFGHKTVGNWLNEVFCLFSTVFFLRKGDEMLLYLNYEARFGIPGHLGYFRPPFVMIYTF